jgi:NTE family protein
MTVSQPATALVLTGGGARAAYQVGVLKAIAQLRRESGHGASGNPFPIIAGTSAGAINAAALACRADHFEGAVRRLCRVWENLHADQVYRADSLGVIRTGARWLTVLSIGWTIARWRRASPRSLLDNSPLEALLNRMVSTERLHKVMRQGHLQALAIAASSYASGHHVTFYEATTDIEPWSRPQRVAVRGALSVQHLMASAAIPFVFPAVPLSVSGRIEHFGDGTMRQEAPISPAVHLGADRVLVVGSGRLEEPDGERSGTSDYPSLAEIAGHALSNIFLDALAVDVERVQNINTTLKLLSPEARAKAGLKIMDVLIIAPSERLDDLAAKHLGELPLPIRALLRGLGVQPQGFATHGAALASYLLFEPPYTRELMALGMADTLKQSDAVLKFFGWDVRPTAS